MIDNITIEPRVDKQSRIHVDISNGSKILYDSLDEFMADIEKAYHFANDVYRMKQRGDKDE